jgi:hypothetical protein
MKLAAVAALMAAAPAAAQMSQADPYAVAPAPDDPSEPVDPGPQDPYQPIEPARAPSPSPAAPAAPAPSIALTPTPQVISRDETLAAAERVFGKGAKDLGVLIERILRDQGEPSAYIAGQEAGGAFGVGLRYGSGKMRHRVEGERKIFWTGPSIGFDLGADANKVFVLVYNLHDSQDLYRRFPNAEGHAYAVGGFTASYLRRGDIVLIPIRLGVGLRFGVNAGYMSFSEKSRWLPF